MIQIYYDWSVETTLGFFAWTLVVCTFTKAVFGSFFAREFEFWLNLRDRPKAEEIRKLQWEINHRSMWSDDVVQGSPHSRPIKLTNEEIEQRRVRFGEISRTSFLSRALRFFLTCTACQTFWVALLLMYVTSYDEITPLSAVMSAAAYSGCSVLMIGWGKSHSSMVTKHAETGGCKDCGGKQIR